MFEQSLLLDHAAGKKTGALAASLTAQTLMVGALIAIPLIYGDKLPDVRLFIPLSLPLPPPRPLPRQEQTQRTSSSSRASYAPPKIYTPTHIADLSKLSDVAFVEAPPALGNASDNGVPGGTGSSQTLNPFLRETIPQAKAAVVEAPPKPTKPISVGTGVQAAKVVKKVIPDYPVLARQARVSGTVRLLGIIAKDGTIQQLQVVSGHPLLVKAALDAVRQWIYRPTLLNGQAVEVIAPIDVIFTLGQ